jgi:flagellar capping protein FliD
LSINLNLKIIKTMKNLKYNIAKMFIVLSVLFVVSSCKKDKDTEGGTKAGSYTYQGKTISIVSGDYRNADDGVGIFLKGTGTSDYVSLRFPKTGSYNIPIGTLKYNNLPPTNAGYNPAIHFNGGSVTSDGVVLGDPVNGGTVTITKEGDRYTISFDVSTTKGPLKGSFSGSFKKV